VAPRRASRRHRRDKGGGSQTTRLLDRPQVVAGDSEKWSNPDSGVTWTATAGGAGRRHGLACRIVSYQATDAEGESATQRDAHVVQDEGQLENWLPLG
jgi:hypothetical protein